MRSFNISVTLFICLCICVIANAIFIHDCADRIERAADELSAPTEEKLCELETLWEKRKAYIGLSISENHLDSISQTIISLRCAYESRNEAEFKKDLALLSACADEIKRYERLSVENIF